ncbi:KRAB [Mytilus coruscus]|uniref:KRAB n=1 Tax=Mytilus coruscus TaxID=42192 RepID=A0A6J8E4I5_MYTCO|nr:KRAB [Mytilus coruscus]
MSDTGLDVSFDVTPVEECIKTQYSCETCCYSTSNKSNFNKHTKRHKKSAMPDGVSSTKLDCVNSAKPDAFSSTKPISVSSPKPDEVANLCTVCGKTFKSKFGHQLHVKNKHEMSYKHVCSICNKGYNQAVQYRYHISSHVKLPMDKCTFCKAEFTAHGSLKRHLQTCNKTDEGTFICDICQKSFSRKNSLKEHIKGKHKGPRFKCSACGNRYAWRSSLRVHVALAHKNEQTE